MNNLSPVEVDVLYLARLAAADVAQRQFGYACDRLLYAFAHKVYAHSKQWFLHPDSTLDSKASLSELTQASISPTDLVAVLRGRNASGAAREIAAWEQAKDKAAEAWDSCEECETEYQSRPWSRYWLVTSSDGHIHASRGCSTCNKGRNATGFALAAYLSGKPVAEAVADLGPALCSVCFPDAPVESTEQARISARLALALREEGCEAFKRARLEAAGKAVAKAALQCPGSGQQGVKDTRPGYTYWHACPCCGEASRKTSTGKIRPHRKPLFYVENADFKCWTGAGWGPSAKKAIFENKTEAAAVAATCPGATVRRK
jgi:hypothetical protein